jgi:hypothetical protein
LIAASETSLAGVACIAQSEAPSLVSSVPSYCVSPGANVCDAASFFCSAGESSRSAPNGTWRAAELDDVLLVTTAATTAATSRTSPTSPTATVRRLGLF